MIPKTSSKSTTASNPSTVEPFKIPAQISLQFSEKSRLIGKFERRKGLIQVRWRASTDEHGVDARLMQGPHKRKMRLRMPAALCDGFELRETLIRCVMKIDVLMSRNDLEA